MSCKHTFWYKWYASKLNKLYHNPNTKIADVEKVIHNKHKMTYEERDIIKHVGEELIKDIIRNS